MHLFFLIILILFSYKCTICLISNDNKSKSGQRRPNIILILADDLGYSDVDWHDLRLYTPNLRFLAFNQHTTYLTNSYVNQLCTP